MDIKIEKGIPLPEWKSKEVINLILTLEEGDSVHLKYFDFSRSAINIAIGNVRSRLKAKSLHITQRSDKDGMRIWITKLKD